MVYFPAPSLTAERTFSIRAGLAASTVTPGRTAPDVSLTTPVSALWACAAPGSRANSPAATRTALSVRAYSLAISTILSVRRFADSTPTTISIYEFSPVYRNATARNVGRVSTQLARPYQENYEN